MPAKIRYQYVARNNEGREIKGVLVADNEADATGRLRQQQLSVVRLEAAPAGAGPGAKSPFAALFAQPKKANTAQLALFTRQLATMIGAGIPVLEGFEILAEQSKTINKGMAAGLQEAADLVRGGTDLSEAMSTLPKIFPEIYINMIKAGEASGQLDVILNRLADFMEATESLKREIKSAMVYPIVSMVMILGITSFLLVSIVPKFEKVFQSLQMAKLPGPTVFVQSLSHILTNNFWTLVMLIIGTGIAYKLAISTRAGRKIKDLVMLRLPIFGPLFQKVAISRFSRTFSTLLSSGVPILGALEIVAATSGNAVLEETLLATRDTVKAGETLSSHLEGAWIFPPMVVRMIGIGERTGALEHLLAKVSDFYDQQVHATVKSLTSLIEPLLIGTMGIIVGTIVLSIIWPILEIQKKVSG